MPLSVLQCDPGGEKYISFARRKLDFWHEQMVASGQRSIFKVVQVSDGSVIYASSLMAAPGVFMDKIRITGGLKYLWATDAAYPTFSVTVNLDSFDGTTAVYSSSVSLVWPDGSTYILPGSSGTEVAFGGSPARSTYTNFIGNLSGGTSTAPILGFINGIFQPSGPTIDTRTTTYVDKRDIIIERTRAKLDASPVDPLITYLIAQGHPLLPADSTHAEPYLEYKNGEQVTLVEVDYTYIPDVYPGPVPGTIRTDGAFYSAAGGVTVATLARRRTYTYSSTLVWVVGATDAIIDKVYPAVSYLGNVVLQSKNPVTGRGDPVLDEETDFFSGGHGELQITYRAQVATLAALNPAIPPLTTDKLLAAVSRALG